MALLNAGSTFHRCFAYLFVWGNDSAMDPWSGPSSLPGIRSLHSVDVIWISCKQTTWSSMVPQCFCVHFTWPVGGTDWQMTWPGGYQCKVQQVIEWSKLEPLEGIFTKSLFVNTLFSFGSRSFKAGFTVPANHSISINTGFQPLSHLIC